MSIYKKLLEEAEKGGRFKVDLINKTLVIGRKKYIEKGVVLDETETMIEVFDNPLIPEKRLDGCPWAITTALYKKYKVSTPRKHSKCNKSYFKAKAGDDLTLREMANGWDRDYAQAALEGYVLLASLQKWLTWDHDNQWFWQSKDDKDLVILRNWI